MIDRPGQSLLSDSGLKAATVLAGLAAAGLGIKTLVYLAALSGMPVDLALRWWDSKALLNGENYFLKHNEETYPPSFLLLIRPLIGWPYAWAVWIWTAITLGVWLIAGAVFNPETGRDRKTLLLVASLALPSLWQGIGVGQFAAFSTGVMMLVWALWTRPEPSLPVKLLLPLLIAFAAGKFSLFLPVMLFGLFVPGFRLSILMAALIHALLMVVASGLLVLPLTELIGLWMSQGRGQAALGASDWFALSQVLGIERPWNIIAALTGAAGLSAWLALRKIPPETAFVVLLVYGRVWMYHAPYDNVMLWPAALLMLRSDRVPVWISMLMAGSLFIPARVIGWETVPEAFLTALQLAIWIGGAVAMIRAGQPGSPVSRMASESSPPRNAS